MKVFTLKIVLFSFMSLIGILSGLPESSISAEEKITADSLFKKAEDHFFEKRYRIALALLNSVITMDPEYPKAYSYRGDIHLILGNLKLAEDDFRVAAEISVDPAYEYFRLGQTLFLQKKGDEAFHTFKESLRLKPDLHINRFYIGLVYYELLNDRSKTIVYWKDYLRLVPEDPQADQIRLAIEELADPDFILPSDLGNSMKNSER